MIWSLSGHYIELHQVRKVGRSVLWSYHELEKWSIQSHLVGVIMMSFTTMSVILRLFYGGYFDLVV